MFPFKTSRKKHQFLANSDTTETTATTGASGVSISQGSLGKETYKREFNTEGSNSCFHCKEKALFSWDLGGIKRIEERVDLLIKTLQLGFDKFHREVLAPLLFLGFNVRTLCEFPSFA